MNWQKNYNTWKTSLEQQGQQWLKSVRSEFLHFIHISFCYIQKFIENETKQTMQSPCSFGVKDGLERSSDLPIKGHMNSDEGLNIFL